MKRLAIMLCILLLLSSCRWQPESYIYPNEIDKVVSVELVHNQNVEGFGIDEKGFVHIRYLEDKEIANFLNEVRALETHWWKSNPRWGYGPYFAKVLYENGDIEILGVDHIEYVPIGNDPTGYGRYRFNWDAFMAVFSEYAQIHISP